MPRCLADSHLAPASLSILSPACWFSAPYFLLLSATTTPNTPAGAALVSAAIEDPTFANVPRCLLG